MQSSCLVILIVALNAIVAVQPSNAKAISNFRASRRDLNKDQYKRLLQNLIARRIVGQQSESEDSQEQMEKRVEPGTLDKTTCSEIVTNRHMIPGNGFPAKDVSTVEECMAYCDSLEQCVAWDYYPTDNNNLKGAGTCNPKGPWRPPSESRDNVLSGYCDSCTQTKTTTTVTEPTTTLHPSCSSCCSLPPGTHCDRDGLDCICDCASVNYCSRTLYASNYCLAFPAYPSFAVVCPRGGAVFDGSGSAGSGYFSRARLNGVYYCGSCG